MSSRFLQQLRREHRPDTAAGGRQLYYRIKGGRPPLHLQLLVAAVQPNGMLDAAQAYRLQIAHLHQPPPFLDAADISLLTELLDHDPNWLEREQGPLPPGVTADWLEKLVATGRARLGEHQSLRAGDSLPLTAHWRVDGGGCQQLEWQCPPDVHLLDSKPRCYLALSTARLGRVVDGLSEEARQWLSKGLRLEADELAGFIAQWGQTFSALGLPLPRHIHLRQLNPAPQPQLYLYRSGADTGIEEDRLKLQFCYECDGDTLVFDHADRQLKRRSYRPAQLEVLELQRDPDAEAALEQALFAALEDYSPEPLAGTEMAFAKVSTWRAIMLELVPELRRRGWRIKVDPHFRHNVVRAQQVKLAASWLEAHWFDLALSVDVNGELLPLLPLLAECARRYTPARLAAMDADIELPLRLPDGRQLLVAAGRLAHWLAVLVELHDDGVGDSLRLPASQLHRLAGLEAGLQGSPESDALLERARRIQTPPNLEGFALPPGFCATLRGYQRLGVAWLQQRRQLGVGGILADDMGLGKTVQTLAHLSIEHAAGRLSAPALVVAPTSVLHNWAQEAARFAPALRCAVLHGAGRHDRWQDAAACDLVLTSYALVVRDIDRWRQQPLSVVILDEAQAIKNARTQTARQLRRLQAPYKICLTGTPLENHLGELWSLFEFMMPGFLDSEDRFNRHYRKPIENEADQDRAKGLMQRIAPFMLRRTKVDVAPDLPPKTEIVVRLPLQGNQRDLYETLRQRCVDSLKPRLAAKRENRESQDNQGRVLILNALMTLRQACCDPRLIDSEAHGEAGSAKCEYLLEMLEELVDEGRTVLVFSQFTRMLDLIAEALNQRRIDYLMLTGKSRDRAALVSRFQAGEAPVFLISLKAGGTGLNLTRADTVVHYDPWWNSAAQAQATDRAYRIGQDKPVFVYKLLAEDTVEEKIHTLQQHKQDLLQQVYDVAEATTGQLALDNADLLALFD